MYKYVCRKTSSNLVATISQQPRSRGFWLGKADTFIPALSKSGGPATSHKEFPLGYIITFTGKMPLWRTQMEEAIYFLSQQISYMAAKLETALEKNNDTLKKINRELLIANLPPNLHDYQRYYFDLEEQLEMNVGLKQHYEEKLNKAKENGDIEQIQRYEIWVKDYNDIVNRTSEILTELEEKGCIAL